jgi:hypothetical protein
MMHSSDASGPEISNVIWCVEFFSDNDLQKDIFTIFKRCYHCYQQEKYGLLRTQFWQLSYMSIPFAYFYPMPKHSSTSKEWQELSAEKAMNGNHHR